MDRNKEKNKDEQTTENRTEMYNGRTSAIWQHQMEMHLIKAHAERLADKMMKGKGKEGPFLQQKEEENCKTATTKADSKNYNATTKADSNTFTLPRFCLILFAHNFLALFTHVQTNGHAD